MLKLGRREFDDDAMLAGIGALLTYLGALELAAALSECHLDLGRD